MSHMSDLALRIRAFESGEMDDEETVALVQTLVDTGLVWQLRSIYGRIATDMIRAGLVRPPRKEVSA